MILTQRKRHRYIWILLAILLPLGYLLSWRTIPTNKIRVNTSIPEEISVALTGGELEITVEKPLATPGLLVLIGEDVMSNPEAATMVGQLHGEGIYKFQLPESGSNSNPSQVWVYNPFSKTIVGKFSL